MSERNLLKEPCWQGSDLGHPLPDHPHAVSMALPRWRDVIAYEEHEPTCRAALQTIYPRFGLHPFLQELANQVTSNITLQRYVNISGFPTNQESVFIVLS